MTETVRTSIYVGVAAFSLLVAWMAGPTVAKAPKEFSQVGTVFYPDFTDAAEAKSLQVVSYNSDTATVRVFMVEQGPDGIWRIPSRNNYPVDGKDRLSKTATSVIGIKREALAGQRKTQHADFGVLDPLAENVSDFKGVGNRLTLKDGKDGKVLADLIIGKEVKGRHGYYYVRNPKEDQTYIAKVNIDVSTKFVDWIEPDLLKLDGTKLRSIVIDKHTFEIVQQGGRSFGKETNKETNTLTRTSSTDKWKLEGVDEATEEVNEDEVRKMVQALDDLKIVGVRRKNDRLKKSLESDQGITPDERTVFELQDMGYYLIPTKSTKNQRALRMISQEGDLMATTEQGVLYELHFGSVFSGTEEEVEAGFLKQSESNDEGEKKEGEKKEEDQKESEAPGKDDSKSKKIKSRYLFVQVAFDIDALGPKPEAPEKPEAPAEDTAAPIDADAPVDATAAENAGGKVVDPKKAYEAATAKYEADLRKHVTDINAYEEKIKAGEKQVKELNRRFAEWYYVISGDSFENLRQGRKTLVKPKTESTNPAPAQQQ